MSPTDDPNFVALMAEVQREIAVRSSMTYNWQNHLLLVFPLVVGILWVIALLRISVELKRRQEANDAAIDDMLAKVSTALDQIDQTERVRPRRMRPREIPMDLDVRSLEPWAFLLVSLTVIVLAFWALTCWIASRLEKIDQQRREKIAAIETMLDKLLQRLTEIEDRRDKP